MKRLILMVVCCALIGSIALAQAAGTEPTVTKVLTDFDGKFLFAYGTWNGKAKTENGLAVLRGFNNQGGAGMNVQFNLLDNLDDTPAVRVTIGKENKADALRIMLRDQEGRSAGWRFVLKGLPAGESQLVTSFEGAPLTEPNESGKDGVLPDFTQITQVQVQGDWAGGRAVDLEVDAIVLVKPDATIRAARAEKVKRLAAEAETKRKQREDLKARYGKRTDQSPKVQAIYTVAPDVLAVEIQAQRVTPATLVKYEPQPGDKRRENKLKSGVVNDIVLSRNGKEIGWLTGPNWDWLNTYEGIIGDPLLEFVAEDIANYSVQSADDSAYSQAVKPAALYRKAKANDWAQGLNKLPLLHTVYLRLDKPLTIGKTYTINFGEVNTQTPTGTFKYDPTVVRSEAVHVQQIGYRPDDPLKRAFVSCWLGTGGRLELPATLKFSIVDDATGKSVYTGASDMIWPAGKKERMQQERNHNATDVARLDFSSFNTPGKYRIVVEGIGSSYPFEINADVWKRAFWVQMKGLYNNRSGEELGPPYTDFKKPRDMHPADGYSVTASTHREVDSGHSPAELAKGDTGKKVDGWGGYHDAGDWNPRRVTHMRVTMAQLEIFDLFPDFFSKIDLNIPKTPGVPDVITEAIFEFMCFRRMQHEDGGVPFQLESDGDPSAGEVSWLNRRPTYASAPDHLGSWHYAAVGARLSRLLEPYDAKQAADFRDSAIRAFAFGEKDAAEHKAKGKTVEWQAADARNLAAVELYRTTANATYHEVYLEQSALKAETVELFQWGKSVQRDAAFAYARLPEKLGDPALKKKAVAATAALADRALEYAANNAFGVTSTDQGKPQFLSFYSTGNDLDLARAHYLTNEPKYLSGLLQAHQFAAGCNPNNVVYTSGLGANPVKNPFKIDNRRTGQSVPIGLTVAGNIDYEKWGHQNWVIWPITWHLGPIMTPHPLSWPTHEAFFDVWMYPAMLEYCVDWWAPNVFNWGYLAARGPFEPATERKP